MSRFPVVVPPRVLAGLRRHAAAALPAECCGALIGSAGRDHAVIRTLIPVANTESRRDRYYIDAATVLRLERRAASAGHQVVGFYHSHTMGTAAPSPVDLELACPGYVYFIIAPHDGGLRGWRLREDRCGFTELDLVNPLAGAA